MSNAFIPDLWREKKYLRATNKLWPTHLSLMTKASYPDGARDPIPDKVYRSCNFLVQEYNEKSGLIRLSINRTDIDSKGQWKEGITWDEIQLIKKQAGYGDCEAVEIYPKDQHVINVANIRHLWIFTGESPLTFAWKKNE